MSDITHVYLITGFLGSGKTTFLNRIIDRFPKDKKLTILMNEFGEIGIDGTLVEGDDIDMLEISRGSIFCACVKTDFIKGLYELNTKAKPDVLLIESTGVANPTDLKRDIKLPIFNDRFQFMDQFCLVDAAHFLDAYEAYASIEKQITSSSVFIINKTDLASPEKVKEIKDLIRKFHPEPFFYVTTFADIPFDRFFFPEVPSPSPSEVGLRPVMSNEELEKYIDELLDNPDLEITPPDRLVSVSYHWSGEDLEEVRSLAQSLPKAVLRAKGFVEEKGTTYLFNYVMGDWTIEPSKISKDRIHQKNVLVFIGPPESMEGIDEASRQGNWWNMGVFQPMSQNNT